ncbi:hypothetical protein [Delftia acidovorans]|uniref:hypothetical protein n=1 Tax=Delftia acidovorans TaxID=80866 RepID=UPI0009B6D85F|nr:hypothetical protein [Delftia acidovorans]QPS74893.1 hypothetical protein I6G48_30540 [Delftia acidovorans]
MTPELERMKSICDEFYRSDLLPPHLVAFLRALPDTLQEIHNRLDALEQKATGPMPGITGGSS